MLVEIGIFPSSIFAQRNDPTDFIITFSSNSFGYDQHRGLQINRTAKWKEGNSYIYSIKIQYGGRDLFAINPNGYPIKFNSQRTLNPSQRDHSKYLMQIKSKIDLDSLGIFGRPLFFDVPPIPYGIHPTPMKGYWRLTELLKQVIIQVCNPKWEIQRIKADDITIKYNESGRHRHSKDDNYRASQYIKGVFIIESSHSCLSQKAQTNSQVDGQQASTSQKQTTSEAFGLILSIPENYKNLIVELGRTDVSFHINDKIIYPRAKNQTKTIWEFPRCVNNPDNISFLLKAEDSKQFQYNTKIELSKNGLIKVDEDKREVQLTMKGLESLLSPGIEIKQEYDMFYQQNEHARPNINNSFISKRWSLREFDNNEHAFKAKFSEELKKYEETHPRIEIIPNYDALSHNKVGVKFNRKSTSVDLKNSKSCPGKDALDYLMLITVEDNRFTPYSPKLSNNKKIDIYQTASNTINLVLRYKIDENYRCKDCGEEQVHQEIRYYTKKVSFSPNKEKLDIKACYEQIPLTPIFYFDLTGNKKSVVIEQELEKLTRNKSSNDKSEFVAIFGFEESRITVVRSWKGDYKKDLEEAFKIVRNGYNPNPLPSTKYIQTIKEIWKEVTEERQDKSTINLWLTRQSKDVIEEDKLKAINRNKYKINSYADSE